MSLLSFSSLRKENRSFVEKIMCVQSLDSDCDMRPRYQCRQVKNFSKSPRLCSRTLSEFWNHTATFPQGVALGWNLRTPSAFWITQVCGQKQPVINQADLSRP